MPEPGWFNDNANRYYPFVTPAGTPSDVVKALQFALLDFGILMGPGSGFIDGQDIVYLSELSRTGSLFTFTFSSTASGLTGKTFSFIRDMSQPGYQTEYFTEDNLFEPSVDSVGSTGDGTCTELFLWQAFLATGDLSDLAALFPSSTTLSGSESLQILPELVRNLSQAFVTSLNLANGDRTRATHADGCPPIPWPDPVGLIFLRAQCLQGDIRFVAGYNTVIQQNDFSNSITIGAAVAAGAGLPCAEVPLFAGEHPPVGFPFLDGSQGCSSVVRTINGVGGPTFSLIAGLGVTITPDPGNNTVHVDMNMNELTNCFGPDISESV